MEVGPMPELSNHSGDLNAHRFAPAAPDEEYVYGACCPGWHSAASHAEAIADWLEFMRAREIDRVCCLLTGQQLDESEGNVDRYRRAFGTEHVRHAPLADSHIADEQILREEILPFLDAAVDREERVVVHCLSGMGRTGQVLAAWLAHDRGYDPERAIETVQEMGRAPAQPVHVGNATERELVELLMSFR